MGRCPTPLRMANIVRHQESTMPLDRLCYRDEAATTAKQNQWEVTDGDFRYWPHKNSNPRNGVVRRDGAAGPGGNPEIQAALRENARRADHLRAGMGQSERPRNPF